MKNLILKYLTGSITALELNKLRNWLTKPKNQKTFEAYIKDDFNLNVLYNAVDVDVAFNNVWKNAKNESKLIPLYRRNIFKYAVAASIVLLISLTFIFNKDNTEFIEPIIVNNNIKTGTDKATLTLEDGTNIILEKGNSYVADNLTSNGEEIVYNTVAATKPEIAYNTLTIPRGGQYFVKLSDGTQVWLNSETQLKYPVSFADGESRQVELVYGEAYFDVSPSTEHQGSNFKVLHDAQEVKVLGTEFNIKAYKDDTNIYTTLVEGEVAVNVNEESTMLVPTEQANLDKATNNISVTVVDVFNETSWKDGVFSFENKSLNSLMQVLSRWYDVEFVFENEALKNVEFFGKLKKSQGVEDILTALKNSSVINNYEINNKTIILK